MTPRPRTRTGLHRLYEALHFELEREFTGLPDNATCKVLTTACAELEGRLRSCPNGDESVETARWNATHADPRFFSACMIEGV